MSADTDVEFALTAAAPSATADADRLLRIYLSDHRAAAGAGAARAKRFAEANADSFLVAAAGDVQRQIAADVAVLDEILDRFGCSPSWWKLVAARAVEVAGRFKLNGRVRGYSPLSRLIELEALVSGIVAKESLWQTLALVQPQRSELNGFDFDELQRRAMQQRMQLDEHRQTTVEEAFRR
jgi:hypothetical protein